MADLYVKSTGSGTAPYDTWAKASTTVGTAVSAASGGDRIFVDSAHSESGGPFAYTFPGTAANPCMILCVDSTGSPEPPLASDLTTGAVITATGATNDVNLRGFAYMYGMKFVSGDDVNLVNTTSQDHYIVLEDCYLELTNTTGILATGTTGTSSPNADTFLRLIDCTYENQGAGNEFRARCPVEWHRGSFVVGAASPTVLFDVQKGGQLLVEGVDLSAANSSLIQHTEEGGDSLLKSCSIHASATLTDAAPDTPGYSVKMHNCDSGNTVYRMEEQYYAGNIVQDTAVYRDAANPGSTNFSIKAVTNANAKEFLTPLKFKLADLWVDTSTTKTFTVEIVHDNATALQDDEIWMEVVYQDDLTTEAFVEDDRVATVLTTPANQTTSSVSWTGTGGFTNENKQKLSVTTASTGKAGPCTVYVYVAKASYTVYVGPLVDVT